MVALAVNGRGPNEHFDVEMPNKRVMRGGDWTAMRAQGWEIAFVVMMSGLGGFGPSCPQPEVLVFRCCSLAQP